MAAFLAIGAGDGPWLVELHGVAAVDRVLGVAALVGRFADNGVIRILAYQRKHDAELTAPAKPTACSRAHAPGRP
ncbi:hypothetical protein [Dactylosporangium sp. NPDC006015]|uniref:hypothetical protein n=1 Tax=Dactylosporangium sp. NPDC006015 TaxID=3154576 RepID=UPI0033A43E42